MPGERSFLDTNVLVYAYDTDAGPRHERARSLVAELWETRAGSVSTQVLQEFYVTVTRKVPKPLTKRVAREVVETYQAWPVYRPDVGDLAAASDLEERHRLAFWDALVIVAAQRSGADVLFSDDLQDERRIAGLTIRNPFA